jgi:hypothetical protein
MAFYLLTQSAEKERRMFDPLPVSSLLMAVV